MQIRPGTLAMTLVLAGMAAVGPIANDLYIPSLPDIAQSLGATTSQTQLTLSAYLIGFAVGQFVYGPISDKFGRKPVLMCGFAIYLVASLMCILADRIELMILARFFQAFGASGPITLSRAIVRDIHEGSRAGKEMATIGSIMGIAPIIGPVLGAGIQATLGWRYCFVFIFAFGLIITLISGALLPETIRTRTPGPLSFSGVVRSFGVVIRFRPFLAYGAILAACYSGMFIFLSSSSFVFQQIYDFSELKFGLAFSCCSLAFVSGTLTSSRIVQRLGLDRSIGVGVTCMAGGSLIELAMALAFPHQPWFIVGSQVIQLYGFGFIISNSMAAGMSPFPERAGAASSLMGLMQMGAAAIVGTLVGTMIGGSVLPVAIAMALTTSLAFVIFIMTRKLRRIRRVIPAGA